MITLRKLRRNGERMCNFSFPFCIFERKVENILIKTIFHSVDYYYVFHFGASFSLPLGS